MKAAPLALAAVLAILAAPRAGAEEFVFAVTAMTTGINSGANPALVRPGRQRGASARVEAARRTALHLQATESGLERTK